MFTTNFNCQDSMVRLHGDRPSVDFPMIQLHRGCSDIFLTLCSVSEHLETTDNGRSVFFRCFLFSRDYFQEQ